MLGLSYANRLRLRLENELATLFTPSPSRVGHPGDPYTSPDHLKIAGVPRRLIHIQEHLQAIQVQIDQILKLSTSFVSVGARISSLKSVRARCCALWMVLE